LKGRGDVRDTERPAFSLLEEKRKDGFRGASRSEPEVADEMGSASESKLRVLTREARGIELEGGEDFLLSSNSFAWW
jgi:hypothetical protein